MLSFSLFLLVSSPGFIIPILRSGYQSSTVLLLILPLFPVSLYKTSVYHSKKQGR